jgi:glycosyltransferase involved in cell wall biosynthesis
MDKEYESSGGLFTKENDDGNSLCVFTITFDEFLEMFDIRHIDFLKIDMEGAEYDLFDSINKDFLRNNVNKIVMEIHPRPNRSSEEILNILKECGFECYFQFMLLYAWKPLKESKKKLMFITPHLSTGGLPQYLVKQVELAMQNYDVYVIEYENLTAGIFVVQKNKIQSMLPLDHFITLGTNKNMLLDIIDRINPYAIHLEEFPELFMDRQLAKSIYANEDRRYFIVETTHNSAFKAVDKVFLPDKFYLVCTDSVNKFQSLGVPIELSEYPVENTIRPDRIESLKKLGLDPSYKHVLNVGLFTPGKNQGEIFEYARKLIGEQIQFHFVGNQAGNFQDYWLPLMQNKPDNCIVWGEKDNANDFYSACDLFLFTSLSELNPIVLKEAISWHLPILMYNLPIYHDSYTSKPGIIFLTDDLNKNLSLIQKSLY